MPSNLIKYSLRPDLLERLGGLDLSHRLSDDHDLVSGNGASCDIWKGELLRSSGGTNELTGEVAVKCLRFYMKEDMKLLFEKEIYVWSKLKHDNILPLLGFAFAKGTGYPLLISPWMERGSAWQYVNVHKDFNPFSLIVDVAHGINFLHEKNVFHSDIKGQNILISSDDPPVARIGDFGTARMEQASLSLAKQSISLKGTARFMAYELHNSERRVAHSKATDVWAFGMTIYELFTRKMPYKDCQNNPQISHAVNKRILPSFDGELSGEPRDLKDFLSRICTECWKFKPDQRITMPEVLEELKGSPYYERPGNENHHRNGHTNSGHKSDIHLDPNVDECKVESEVFCVKFSRDGEYLAVGCKGSIYVFLVSSGQKERTFDYPKSNVDRCVRSLCFTNISGDLASCTGGDEAWIWYTSHDECPAIYKANGKEIHSLVSSETFIICGLGDGSACTIDLTSKKCKPFEQSGEHPAITTIAVSSRKKFVAAGSADSVRIWDSKTMKLVHDITGHPSPVSSVAFTPRDDKIIIAAGKSIKQWKVSDRGAFELLNNYDGHEDDVLSIAVCNDGQWLMSGSKDGMVYFWVQHVGMIEGKLRQHNGQVASVDFCVESNTVVIATKDGQVKWREYDQN